MAQEGAMSQERDEMNRAIASLVVPALRQRGFTGSFPHFRRLAGAKTDLLTFQFDRHGGGFVIEIAEAPVGPFTLPWGAKVLPARLTAHDMPPSQRSRVQPGSDGSTESWFRFDRGLSSSQVAEQVISLLPQTDQWWLGSKNQVNIRPFTGAAT